MSGEKLREILQKARRLLILKALNDSAGYSAEENYIDSALDAMGNRVSRDVVKSEMQYLDEQGLIKLEEVCGLWVATLTQRGVDVADGQAQHHGVARPRPE